MQNPITYYGHAVQGLWESFFPQPNKITSLEREILQEHGASGSRIITPAEDAELYDLFTKVYQRSGKPPPKIIVYDSLKNNAMHLPNGTIAVSSTKLNLKNPLALEATISHEKGHFQQRWLTRGVILGRMILTNIAATAAANWVAPRLQKSKAFFGMAVAGIYTKVLLLTHAATEVLWTAYRRWQERDADRLAVREMGSAEGMIRNIEYHHKAHSSVPLEEIKSEETSSWKKLFREHDDHATRLATLKAEERKLEHSK